MTGQDGFWSVPLAAVCLNVVLALLPGAGRCARQASDVPYDGDYGPSLCDLSVKRSYPGSYDSLKDVDFRNLTAHIFYNQGKSELIATLRKGSFERKLKFSYDSVTVDAVHELPRNSSGTERALVLFTWFASGGSSSTEGVAQVFELRDHRLTITQQLDWDEHFQTSEPYASFESSSNTLTVRAAHYLPGDSHCCVSAMDVVTLRLNKARFAKRSVLTELSDYGKSAGKKI